MANFAVLVFLLFRMEDIYCWKTITFFGFLFIGAYLGAVLGSFVSVALFGQSHWSIPPNQNLVTMEYGIVFHNVPPSPLLNHESLIPVHSLPFLAFFAMSVTRLGTKVAESSFEDRPELPPVM